MTDELNSQVETTEAAPVKKRAFNFQGFTSLLLTLVFMAVAISGVVLYLTPRGRTAHWTDWTMLGLGKEEWGTLHMNTCAVLLLLAVLHLAFNWRMFVGYLRKKATGGLNLKREMLAAGALTALLVVGTVQLWPPMNELADLNTRIKNSWEAQVAEAPVPHSEEFTLTRFAEEINLPVEKMTVALSDEGFAVDDLARTVGDVAREKGVAPSEVLAAIQKHHPEVRGAQGRGQGQGRGMGMGRGRGGFGGEMAGSGEACSSKDGCDSESSEGCSEEGSSCSGEGSGHGPGQGMGMGPGHGEEGTATEE